MFETTLGMLLETARIGICLDVLSCPNRGGIEKRLSTPRDWKGCLATTRKPAICFPETLFELGA